jgi:hypothetical protein
VNTEKSFGVLKKKNKKKNITEKVGKGQAPRAWPCFIFHSPLIFFKKMTGHVLENKSAP